MKRYLILVMISLIIFLLSSCSKEQTFDVDKRSGVTINLSLNGKTRSAEIFNSQLYDGMCYVYLNGAYQQSVPIESNLLQIDNLIVGSEYTLVLLAAPKGQILEWPYTIDEDVIPGLNDAKIEFQDASIGTDDSSLDYNNEIFRCIKNFKAGINSINLDAVLTRQNGAVEIRIKNMEIKKAELNIKGTSNMFFYGENDLVNSEGDVYLKRIIEVGNNNLDVRIRVNLLPKDDITHNDVNGNKLILTLSTGETKEYDLKSDQEFIPVYPNQVTWLTLGTDMEEGNFDVAFGGTDDGGINLDDDEWDGWVQ